MEAPALFLFNLAFLHAAPELFHDLSEQPLHLAKVLGVHFQRNLATLWWIVCELVHLPFLFVILLTGFRLSSFISNALRLVHDGDGWRTTPERHAMQRLYAGVVLGDLVALFLSPLIWWRLPSIYLHYTSNAPASRKRIWFASLVFASLLDHVTFLLRVLILLVCHLFVFPSQNIPLSPLPSLPDLLRHFGGTATAEAKAKAKGRGRSKSPARKGRSRGKSPGR